MITNPQVPHLFPLGRGQPNKVTNDHVLCVAEDKLSVFGSYSSDRGRMINIVLDRCLGQDYCLGEQEIKEWFRSKYIFLRMNRIRFEAKKRGDEAIVKESIGQWVPILTSASIEVPYLVQRSNL